MVGCQCVFLQYIKDVCRNGSVKNQRSKGSIYAARQGIGAYNNTIYKYVGMEEPISIGSRKHLCCKAGVVSMQQ